MIILTLAGIEIINLITNKMKTTKMTKPEMAKAIEEKYAAIPEKQVSAGIYIKTIGRKYVTLVNTWGVTTLVKIDIEEFYNSHF
jgi:ribosomal protein L9